MRIYFTHLLGESNLTGFYGTNKEVWGFDLLE